MAGKILNITFRPIPNHSQKQFVGLRQCLLSPQCCLTSKIWKILGKTTEVSFSNHSIVLIIYRNNKALYYKEVLLLNESLFEHTKLHCKIECYKISHYKILALRCLNKSKRCAKLHISTLVQYETTYINFMSHIQKINFIPHLILKIFLTYHFELLVYTQEGLTTTT